MNHISSIIQFNPFLDRNIFPEICKHIIFEPLPSDEILLWGIMSYRHIKELIKLEQLSKFHRDIIRNYPWDHFMIELTDKSLHVLKLYKFLKLELNSINITDKHVIYLKNCHTIDLCSTEITDVGIKELAKCHTLNLPTCITDQSVKELKNCHTLNLSHCRNITDKSVKELTKCHTLFLKYTLITDECKNGLRKCGVIVYD